MGVNIYVYQIDDYTYGAGFVRSVCEARGRIVDVLPANTAEQVRHLKRKGSPFGDVYDEVVRLAERAGECIGAMPESELDTLYEGFMLDLNAQPFRKRIGIAWRILRGKYQPKTGVNDDPETPD